MRDGYSAFDSKLMNMRMRSLKRADSITLHFFTHPAIGFRFPTYRLNHVLESMK